MSSATVYTAECAPAPMRGRLVVAQSVMITAGRMLGAWAAAAALALHPPTAARQPALWIAGLDRIKGRPRRFRWPQVVDFTNRRSIVPVHALSRAFQFL